MLGLCWPMLGCWVYVGPSWAYVGAMLAHLRAMLAHFGAMLDHHEFGPPDIQSLIQATTQSDFSGRVATVSLGLGMRIDQKPPVKDLVKDDR